jgi:hypothetical protein
MGPKLLMLDFVARAGAGICQISLAWGRASACPSRTPPSDTDAYVMRSVATLEETAEQTRVVS